MISQKISQEICKNVTYSSIVIINFCYSNFAHECLINDGAKSTSKYIKKERENRITKVYTSSSQRNNKKRVCMSWICTAYYMENPRSSKELVKNRWIVLETIDYLGQLGLRLLADCNWWAWGQKGTAKYCVKVEDSLCAKFTAYKRISKDLPGQKQSMHMSYAL